MYVSSTSPSVTPTGSIIPHPPAAHAVENTIAGYSPTDSFEAPAVTMSAPMSSTGLRTALQKHVDFFDHNQNGKISYSDTYNGLVALGVGGIRASGMAVAINLGLARATGASWWEPLTIYTDAIANGKHGSDTDIYDNQGNFSQAKFDELFATYDQDGDNALSVGELKHFRARSFEDETSSFASKVEFDLLMEIAGDDSVIDGQQTRVLTRDRLLEFYDGSLFYKIANRPIPA